MTIVVGWTMYALSDQIRPQIASISALEAKNVSSRVVQKAIAALDLDTKI